MTDITHRPLNSPVAVLLVLDLEGGVPFLTDMSINKQAEN